MATLLRVPEVAAGATDVVLSEWLVEEEAPVRAGAPVVVVETEKAVVEVESEVTGIVLRRLAEGGSTVEVGSPLALLGSQEEVGTDLDALLAELGVTGSGEAPRPAPERREVEEQGPAPSPPSPPPPVPAADPAPAAPANGDRIFATPVARKVLAEGGVDLAAVTGTGPNGRILKKDAEAAVRSASETPASEPPASEPAATPEPTPAPTDASTGFTDVPHSRLRRAVASRLSVSKQTVPHFYLRRSVRVDALLALRERLNAVSSQRISVNDLVIRAVAAAHLAVPDANVIWTDDALRRFDAVDVGVAISSERGLVTPVLRDVERTTPSGVARAVRDFVEQANEGRLQQRDLEGGSITVTNLGMYGVEDFAAIINPPQSAILAVGAAVPTPVVVDDEVVVARVMSLVLSVDHRAIDGALAAQWMSALVECLEAPMRLLA